MNTIFNVNVETSYFIYFLIAINLFSLFIMFLDKKKADLKTQRISEKTLFILACLFGAIGIYFGMFLFHHKTKKWYFVLIIPLIIALNLYLASRGYNFLNS